MNKLCLFVLTHNPQYNHQPDYKCEYKLCLFVLTHNSQYNYQPDYKSE